MFPPSFFLSEGVLMNSVSNSKAIVIALSMGAVGVGALVAACSGSSNSGGPGGGSTADGSAANGNDGGTGGGTVSNSPGSCANSTIPIVFSPMYSAYIPNSTAQTFQIPAVTTDGNPATWSLSDPSQANLQAQSFSVDGTSQPGVMITVAGVGSGGTGVDTTGTVTVIATESDGTCGSATLTITQSSEDEWNVGNSRYNNGNNLHLGGGGGGTRPDGGFTRPEGGVPEGGFPRPEAGAGGGGFTLEDGGSPFETDGGTACTTCHGPTATNFAFKDVQHTPEQTGGFSDDDLKNIILNAQIPDGGYFDPSVLRTTCDAGSTISGDMAACAQAAYLEWQGFHKWVDITDDEMPGVIVYLRSLTPQAQTGTSNFGGGGGKRDGGGGGRRDGGGGGGRDAGGPPVTDSGAPTSDDASLGAD